MTDYDTVSYGWTQTHAAALRASERELRWWELSDKSSTRIVVTVFVLGYMLFYAIVAGCFVYITLRVLDSI